MELKERLATLRREHGLSLRELRDRIEQRSNVKMAISYLSSLERTETTPSIEVLVRIAGAYDMTVEELLKPVKLQGDPEPQYPQSLLEFVEQEGLDDSWLQTLWRVEYRGKRPETVQDWDVLYTVLQRLMEPEGT